MKLVHLFSLIMFVTLFSNAMDMPWKTKNKAKQPISLVLQILIQHPELKDIAHGLPY